MELTKFSNPFIWLINLGILFGMVQSLLAQQNRQNGSLVKDFPFEKILWTYWNSEQAEPPIIVQLCIDNMAKIAQKHNFTFILVNESNARNYIENYDGLFLEVRKNSIESSFKNGANLLRILIIEQHGGIWVDATTVFLNGLAQIQNIMNEDYRHMVANRFSSRPEAMFFYTANGQNRIQYNVRDPRNPDKSILYNEYPNFEIWSIFASKKSPFISKVRETYSNFTVTPILFVEQRFVSEDIFVSYIDYKQDYLYLNMAVTYTLQKKQLQLNRQLGLFGQRQHAFEEYKVWGLHAEYGPTLTTREDPVPYEYLFWFSQQELLQMGFNYLFFMKHFDSILQVTQQKFDSLIKYFDSNHMTFMNFLYNYMNKPTCQEVTFIVEGSIIDELLARSEVYKKYRIMIVSKAQNEEWQEHCAWKHTLWDKLYQKWLPYHQTISLYTAFYQKVHKAKVESILHEKQDLSLMQWVEITLKDNFFLIYEFFYMTVVALILFGSFALMRYALERYFKGTIIFYEDKDSDNSLEKKTSKAYERFIQHKNSQGIGNKQKLVGCLIFALVVMGMFMFNAVEVLGGRDQPLTVLFFVFFTFIVQAYIEEQLEIMKRDSSPHYLRINSIYDLFFIAINYLNAFLCLVHVWRNRFWLNWFAQVLGMVGPCVFKLKRTLDANNTKIGHSSHVSANSQQQKISQKAFYTIRANPHRLIILIFLLITVLLPNLRHMSGQSGYYIKYISIVPLLYLLAIYLYMIIRCFSKKYWRKLMPLVILVIVSLRLYLTINEIDLIQQKFPRVSFFAMNVVVMSLLYLQMGFQVQSKSYRIEALGDWSFDWWEWLFMTVPLFIELSLGLMWFDHYSMGSGFINYWLHYIFFSYNTLTAILLSFMRTEPGFRAIEMKGAQFEKLYDQIEDQ